MLAILAIFILDPRSSAQIRGKNYLNKFFKMKIAFAGRSARRRIR